MRRRAEIELELQRVRNSSSAREKSAYPLLSYEQGVEAALTWVAGLTEDAPMDDETPKEANR